MSKNSFLDDMTPKQKQAAIVCAVCALAIVITLCVTLVLVNRKTHSASNVDESSIAAQDGYDGTAYVVDSGSMLGETEDAGDDYVSDTLFIGDSNTVRMFNNGLISLQQFCAEDGLGIQDAASKKIVAFKGDSTLYSIPDAIAMMKPRRILITLGTNNCSGNMGKDEFINEYKSLIQAIQSKYGYTDIIVNAIPPIPASHSNYPDANQGTIDEYNMALADMCEELNVEFLNSVESLKDENGYGNSKYYVENDIHFTMNGLKALLKYYRTHAYSTEDQRPDTNNIPKRTQSYTSNNSVSNGASATATPTSTASKFTASYYVDSSGGGTLSCGTETGKTKLEYDVTEDANSFTVKAVPNEGYFFIKWSDGTKTAERTDKDFKQNVNVTAVFGTVTITISEDNGSLAANVGDGLSYTAKLSSDKYVSTDSIVWYANDVQVETGEHGTFHLDTAGTYSIYAAITVNGVAIKSKALSMTISAPTPAPTSSPVPTDAPTPTPTPTSPMITVSSAGLNDGNYTVGSEIHFTVSTGESVTWLIVNKNDGSTVTLNNDVAPTADRFNIPGTTYDITAVTSSGQNSNTIELIAVAP